MYEQHPMFVQPPNNAVRVWRYMDFTKLVSFLETRCLFFARADKLGDPFEGSWPRINVHARGIAPDFIPPEGRENWLSHMVSLGKMNKNWPRFNAINCWHMNEHESAAMWRLYLQSNEGIALQSTYQRLRDSFSGEEKVYLGVVKYIDYENEWIEAGNLLNPFVHKRKSFEHEREIRALITRFPSAPDWPDLKNDTIHEGVQVPVDVDRLVEHIYVAPSAPSWFAKLVREVIARYGFRFEVTQSKLDEGPVF